MINKLDLDSEERDKISKIAQDRRFHYHKDELLYSQDKQKLFEHFVKSYDFLFYLKESNISEDIKKKIEKYLSQFDDVYNEISIQLNNAYGNEVRKHNFKKESQKLHNKYSDLIKQIIIDVLPLGRIVKEYDPDEAVGI